MAIHGYYAVSGIACHEYKQGWKVLTLRDGYGVSEATWENQVSLHPTRQRYQPHFGSYLVENNEGQLLTRAETLSQRKKKTYSPCSYLFIVPNQTADVASFRRQWYTPDIPSSGWQSPSGHSCRHTSV